MAYVAPKGTIELYSQVPLTPEYNHTLYFSSPEEQRAYFSARSPRTFNNQMYTRVHGNKIRINVNAEDVARYNYLGFTNRTPLESNYRWYYAFIDKIEYINEQVTEITYILDNVQTWYMSAIFRDCFIERQHSTTDGIGDNVQVEPIAPKEHIAIPNLSRLIQYYNVGYVVCAGVVRVIDDSLFSNCPLFTQVSYGGLASSVAFIYFNNATRLNAFIKLASFVDGVFSIVNICTCQLLSLYAIPADLFSSAGNSYQTVNVSGFGDIMMILPQYANEISGIILNPPTVQGEGPYYTPKNKKLFTYPYSFIRASFPTLSQDFKFENFFNAGNTAFRVYATCNPTPSIIIIPVTYERDEDQYHYSLALDNFPQLPIYMSSNDYALGRLLSSTIKTAIETGATLLATGLSTEAAVPPQISNETALVPIANDTDEFQMSILRAKQASLFKAPKQEDTASYYSNDTAPVFQTYSNLKSSGGSSDLAPIMATKFRGGAIANEPCFQITFQQYGLRTEIAKRIDEFFQKYGYAQNKVDRPNIHARTRYTYIKTRGCSVDGAIPEEARRTINMVMDKGITWWADTSGVCYYTDGNGNLIDNPIRT